MTNSKDTLKVQALTQRIATLVANYEDQMAELRAQATIEIEGLQGQISALREQIEAERAVDVKEDTLQEKVPYESVPQDPAEETL